MFHWYACPHIKFDSSWIAFGFITLLHRKWMIFIFVSQWLHVHCISSCSKVLCMQSLDNINIFFCLTTVLIVNKVFFLVPHDFFISFKYVLIKCLHGGSWKFCCINNWLWLVSLLTWKNNIVIADTVIF